MSGYRLRSFEFRTSKKSKDFYIGIAGHRIYIEKLNAAFPEIECEPAKEANEPYYWYTRAGNWSEDFREPVTAFLILMQGCVALVNDLDECFALDWNFATAESGIRERTVVGELVYASKPYDRQPNAANRTSANELARRLISFVQSHPVYRLAEAIISVPPSNPNKQFDLPTMLAESIGKEAGKPVLRTCVSKTRATTPMKDLSDIAAKRQNITGAFEIVNREFVNKRVMVIDDLYDSGETICEAGRLLRANGAKQVFGLVATKTLSF